MFFLLGPAALLKKKNYFDLDITDCIGWSFLVPYCVYKMISMTDKLQKYWQIICLFGVWTMIIRDHYDRCHLVHQNIFVEVYSLLFGSLWRPTQGEVAFSSVITDNPPAFAPFLRWTSQERAFYYSSLYFLDVRLWPCLTKLYLNIFTSILCLHVLSKLEMQFYFEVWECLFKRTHPIPIVTLWMTVGSRIWAWELHWSHNIIWCQGWHGMLQGILHSLQRWSFRKIWILSWKKSLG